MLNKLRESCKRRVMETLDKERRKIERDRESTKGAVEYIAACIEKRGCYNRTRNEIAVKIDMKDMETCQESYPLEDAILVQTYLDNIRVLHGLKNIMAYTVDRKYKSVIIYINLENLNNADE